MTSPEPGRTAWGVVARTPNSALFGRVLRQPRRTAYRPFGAPASKPWERRDDTPNYRGKHRAIGAVTA